MFNSVRTLVSISRMPLLLAWIGACGSGSDAGATEDSAATIQGPVTEASADSSAETSGSDSSTGSTDDGSTDASADSTSEETGNEVTDTDEHDSGGSEGTTGGPPSGFPDPSESRVWIHVAETSALVYFRAGPIEQAATSYVEYGPSNAYGMKTTKTTQLRSAQLHRITRLSPGTTYHFRMVLVADAGEVASGDDTFTTEQWTDVIRIPQDVVGPPYMLDQAGSHYVLTEDITAAGTAIELSGTDATLELDGHVVTFGTESSEQVYGVLVSAGGTPVVGNGHIVQGDSAGEYSVGVEAKWRTDPIEVFGITTEIHRPNGYPVRLFGSTGAANVHHNHFVSTVTTIESRHYPGNDLFQVTAAASSVSVVDNLFSEGCHRALLLSGDAPGGEVAFNDIQHNMQFTNGYAMSIGASGGVDIHDNRVTSMGRGAHLSAADIDFHDNHLDLVGHMALDDLPEGSGNFQEARIEVHGIKLEGSEVLRARVHGNFVRIVQRQPDGTWDYTPPTPLNIASYAPDAGNEIFENTFIALTTYGETYHGDYFNSGQWASPLFFINMVHGAAPSGGYTAYVHDNEFTSNDVFVGADAEVNMTLRIENNTFTLPNDPPPTSTHSRYYNIGAMLENVVEDGSNVFNE